MDKDIRVIRLTEDMLPTVAELEKVCFHEPWNEKSLELLLGEQGVGFAVLEGESVAAYGGMMTVLDEGQITNVAVFPEYRRRGYGRAVMEALEAYARENSLSVLSLEVRVSNESARALYRSLLWREVGLRKNFYRLPTEDAVVMVKDI